MANISAGKVFYKDIKPYEKTGGSCSGTTQESLDEFLSHMDIWCADDLRNEWRYYETSNDGYVFEWKGELWVDLGDARLLKCKNKDKTKIHEIETDNYGFAYLNKHAVTNDSWNRLYFHEVSFAMYVGDSFQYRNTSPLNDSFIQLTDNKLDFKNTDIPTIQTVNVENYKINGKNIQGLMYKKNSGVSSAKPYRLDPKANIYTYSANGGYYWDMVPHNETFVFASNFNQLSDEDLTQVIKVENGEVLFCKWEEKIRKDIILGRIPVEWVPYLIITIKYVENASSDLPTYGFALEEFGWSTNMDKNMFAFTWSLGAANDYPSFATHLIGRDLWKDYQEQEEISTITIEQKQRLRHLWIKTYPNLRITLTKTYCQINNGPQRPWIDWIEFARESANEDIISENDITNALFTLGNKEYNDSAEHDDGMHIAKILFNPDKRDGVDEYYYDNYYTRVIVKDRGKHGWYPDGAGNKYGFSGFNVKIKTQNYNIKNLSIPVFDEDWILSRPDFKVDFFVTKSDVKAGLQSMKELPDREKWNGCLISMANCQWEIAMPCGCINTETFLTKEMADVYDYNGETFNQLSPIPMVRSVSFDESKLKKYNGQYLTTYGHTQGNIFAAKQGWSSLSCAKIGFIADKNYGWAISASTGIYTDKGIETELFNPKEYPGIITYKWKDRVSKTVTYTVTNNSGLKKRIQLEYTDGSHSQKHDFMPYEVKDISCNVGSTQTTAKQALWEEIL